MWMALTVASGLGGAVAAPAGAAPIPQGPKLECKRCPPRANALGGHTMELRVYIYGERAPTVGFAKLVRRLGPDGNPTAGMIKEDVTFLGYLTPVSTVQISGAALVTRYTYRKSGLTVGQKYEVEVSFVHLGHSQYRVKTFTVNQFPIKYIIDVDANVPE